MVVGLTGKDNYKLVKLMASKDFASNSTRLKLILYNADLRDVTNRLDFDQAPYELIFNIIQDLSQMGADESGREALGRFLNTIIDENFVTDQQEKQFINSLIKNYGMMHSPSVIPPDIPAPQRPVKEEKDMLLQSIPASHVSLSKLCSEIIKDYNAITFDADYKMYEFWDDINIFYKEAKKAKSTYKVEHQFTELGKKIGTISAVIKEKKSKAGKGLSTVEQDSIITDNFREFIDLVTKIEEKAVEEEN